MKSSFLSPTLSWVYSGQFPFEVNGVGSGRRVQKTQEIRSTRTISNLVQNSFLAVCTFVVTCSCTINRRFQNRLHDQLYHHHHSITPQNTRARQGWLMVWKTCPATSMDHNGSSSFQRILFSCNSPMSLNIASTVYEQNIASDVEGSSSWAGLGTHP